MIRHVLPSNQSAQSEGRSRHGWLSTCRDRDRESDCRWGIYTNADTICSGMEGLEDGMSWCFWARADMQRSLCRQDCSRLCTSCRPCLTFSWTAGFLVGAEPSGQRLLGWGCSHNGCDTAGLTNTRGLFDLVPQSDSYSVSVPHPFTAVGRKRPRSFCQKCRWQVTPKHVYILDPMKSEWADCAAVQAQCGNLFGNMFTRNLSGNNRPQSSQRTEPL